MNSRSIRRGLLALLAGASFFAVTPDTMNAAPRSGGPLTDGIGEIVHHPLLGTPALIRGHFRVDAPASDAVAVARGFLREQRERLGLQDPDNELRVVNRTERDELGMSHVKFARYHRGLPVFGSELVVHMRGNLVTSFNGVYLPSLKSPVRVLVEADDAAELAIDHLRDLIQLGDADGVVAGRSEGLDLDATPELVFFNPALLMDKQGPTHLAWKLSINDFVYFVSARTGAILDAFDNIHTALKRQVYTAKNGTTLPGTLVCEEGRPCTTTDQDALAAWRQFEETYNYFMDTHDRDSWDGRGGALIGTVHYSTNFINAYWDGEQMVFGDGLVVEDVTAHELGHGVCQATANLTYRGQSGALNESYSDVWGAMVDREDWEIGEDLPDIGTIRDMSDPNAYNQPKDMTEYRRMFFRDNGGVHINSGIPNYAAYLLADGGTNQGVQVVGQGREVLEKIWYRTERTRLTSSSNFADFARLAIEACGELYGQSSTQCTQTTNAFKAVKIL